jgi:hypothetical protein
VTKARVTIGSSRFAVTKTLSHGVKDGKVKKPTVLVTASDTGHLSTRLSLTLKV